MVNEIPEEYFDVEKEGQVEIIGWLYQFYNTEPKDRAFKKKKYATSDIPAVTQLFTPEWIVKYLVQNSLGRYWIDVLRAKGSLKNEQQLAKEFGWKYYMPAANENEIHFDSELKSMSVKEITFIDPAMGSGHILAYAFELFIQMYEHEGYTQREAAKLILQNNLYGLDIDTRAFQLTYFALMMKGRKNDRRFFKRNINLNIVDIPESDNKTDFLLRKLSSTSNIESSNVDKLIKIINKFEDGNILGSLVKIDSDNYDELNSLLQKNMDNKQLSLEEDYLELGKVQINQILAVSKILSKKYTVSVSNPPYMGSGKMNTVLKKYVQKNYPNSKFDLFAVFIERLTELTEKSGYIAMITQHSWMFLSSFEKLRQKLQNETIINLAHLGPRAFEEIGGEVVQSVAFILQNKKNNNYVGTYERLTEFSTAQEKETNYLKSVENQNSNYVYRSNQAKFKKIPSNPISYWASRKVVNNFKYKSLYDFSISPSQNVTGNNPRFLRFFWEINHYVIGNKNKWIFYAKGGGYRKWWGNLINIINWSPEARKIYQYGDGKHASQIINKKYWYKRGITWGLITSKIPSFRIMPQNATFDKGGSTIIIEDNDVFYFSLGLLNSKVYINLVSLLNPTLNSQVKDIRNLPVLPVNTDEINSFVKKNIILSRNDWDSFETSWDFKKHPILSHIAEHNLSPPCVIIFFKAMCQKCVKKFNTGGINIW